MKARSSIAIAAITLAAWAVPVWATPPSAAYFDRSARHTDPWSDRPEPMGRDHGGPQQGPHGKAPEAEKQDADDDDEQSVKELTKQIKELTRQVKELNEKMKETESGHSSTSGGKSNGKSDGKSKEESDEREDGPSQGKHRMPQRQAMGHGRMQMGPGGHGGPGGGPGNGPGGGRMAGGPGGGGPGPGGGGPGRGWMGGGHMGGGPGRGGQAGGGTGAEEAGRGGFGGSDKPSGDTAVEPHHGLKAHASVDLPDPKESPEGGTVVVRRADKAGPTLPDGVKLPDGLKLEPGDKVIIIIKAADDQEETPKPSVKAKVQIHGRPDSKQDDAESATPPPRHAGPRAESQDDDSTGDSRAHPRQQTRHPSRDDD